MSDTEKPNDGEVKGTLRQEKAAQKISEIIRSGKKLNGATLGKVLLDSGYSKSISQSPNKVTKSKDFQYLLNKYLPEKSLVKKHKELLHAANVIDSFIFPNALEDKEIRAIIESVPGCVFIRTKRNSQNAHAYFYKPDNGTQTKALELAYKVHKKVGGDGSGFGDDGVSEEVREVVFRIRKILPQAGQ